MLIHRLYAEMITQTGTMHVSGSMTNLITFGDLHAVISRVVSQGMW
jgi:hypothetical protein